MDGVRMSFNCDWCGGEIEYFPNAKSGLRCIRCWKTEGINDGLLHIVKRSDPEHYLNKEVKKK